MFGAYGMEPDVDSRLESAFVDELVEFAPPPRRRHISTSS
jgi:hypothetical protein